MCRESFYVHAQKCTESSKPEVDHFAHIALTTPVIIATSNCSTMALTPGTACQLLSPQGWQTNIQVKDLWKAGESLSRMPSTSKVFVPPTATVRTCAYTLHPQPPVQTLLDQGASLLGKTKLCSFLSREEPSESVDFQTAWNPRGDGHQGPGGSSSGSAAAVAAYPWVDIAMGTDSEFKSTSHKYNG